MTAKQADTISFLWGKDHNDIYEVIHKIIDQNKLDCVSVSDASDMIDLFNISGWDDEDDNSHGLWTRR